MARFQHVIWHSPVLFLKREKTAGQALCTVSPTTARGQQVTASQKGQQPFRQRFRRRKKVRKGENQSAESEGKTARFHKSYLKYTVKNI